ncbi:heparinase II/III family protein [Frankia sp. CiP3]|uniref:heparinase II/III domain-containing protein n=1 Tax=Frankia sp. CiP3 TaxID=2880971 RepID=UPI001EF553C9|nr:heparinase II/III family protein [Frankia sp. CiP3]
MRVAAETQGLVEGVASLFGRRVSLGERTDWHAAIEGFGRWPPSAWWQIDIRSDARIADVKWTWELGRLRHLVVLARAVALTADQAALARLRVDVHSWCEQNPPESGIHWYSNLEVALRAFALVQVVELAGELLGSELRERIGDQLVHSARHILTDLPYTASSMRNNHWLGDSLGLLVLDRVLPVDRLAGTRVRFARWLFDHQLRRQLRTDGSMIEDSISYHRFVLEMLVVRMLVDPTDQVRDALVRAAQFLSRLGVFDGPVPQYGDWDEGRVLASSGDPLDVAGSVAAALSLGGNGASQDWRTTYDECAWYARPGTPIASEPPEADGHDIGGGIARSRRGLWTSWLKAGSEPSHGHADLCSTPVLHGNRWVVGDPGTGTYNGPLVQRNGLRTTAAHSALQLGGEDQLVPHRAFRWLNSALGCVGPPLVVGDAVVSWGFHTAYRRFDPSRRVARLVVTEPRGVVCVDYVEGPPGLAWELTLPLAPDVEVDADASTLLLPGSGTLHLTLPARAVPLRGSHEPWGGWWSRTYGSIEPTTWLLLAGRVDGPVLWGVHQSAEAPARTEGGDLVVGGTTLHLTWAADHVALTARGESRTTVFARGKM